MVKESDLATEAEMKEAIAQGMAEAEDKAKKALAARATSEIMAEHGGGSGGEDSPLPPLPSGWYAFPDPPPDALILALGEVVYPLQDRLNSANTHDRDDLTRELVERMGEAGVLVRVQWHYSAVPGVLIPEVEPFGVDGQWTWAVVDHPDYDPDHQVHDVTNDILDTGDKGVIGGSGLILP